VNPTTGKPYGNLVVLPAGQWAYATLALGSALALFVYPHAATGLFAAKRRDVIRRNAAMLPAYTLVLGLIALFGYLARAVPAVNAGVVAGHGNAQLSVPLLFATMFPSWFAGVADAAIIIGALVPAAIMSIAAANLFTRTIYIELFRPYASAAEETRVARLASLLMKVGALGFALELNKTFSINLQLLGGIWILQTFPSVVIGLFTRWFHRAALIIGWMAGMAYGTVQAYRTSGGGQAHFGASAAPVFGHTTYIAITALLLNLAVSAVLSVAFKAFGLQDGYDETKPADYVADPVPAPAPAGGSARGRERRREREAAHAAGHAAVPSAERVAEPTAEPAAKPAARGRPPWDPAVPWSLGGIPEEATVATRTTAAAGATAAAEPPAPGKATAPDDDSTVVFDIPASLTGRPRSQERPLRRK
jgi:solute:Na+ symporter, SSS family